MISTLLSAAFQSVGTVHDVPEMINIWITNQHHGTQLSPTGLVRLIGETAGWRTGSQTVEPTGSDESAAILYWRRNTPST
jgi:hypothetical protein